MAAYHLAAKVIGRSAGRSATGAAAYRAADRIADDRTGVVFDYGRKGGVEHREILAPDNAPEWIKDRAQLWNAVEAAEKRKDAQLAREVEVALPRELSREQRLELVRGFIREEFVGRGMVADLAVHSPPARDGAERPHAHIMLTMRSLTGDGFGPKAREWNGTDRLEGWRERGAEHANRALERAGRDQRIDHRSYVAQGIDREPQPKLGPVATAMERRGEPSERGDELRQVQARNAERAGLARQLDTMREALVALKERAGQALQRRRRGRPRGLRRGQGPSGRPARSAGGGALRPGAGPRPRRASRPPGRRVGAAGVPRPRRPAWSWRRAAGVSGTARPRRATRPIQGDAGARPGRRSGRPGPRWWRPGPLTCSRRPRGSGPR